MDPVDWFSWLYGKGFFYHHPNWGAAIIGGVAALLAGGIVGSFWLMGAERYRERHPLQPNVAIGHNTPIVNSNKEVPMPSVLSLFMTDFKGKGSGAGLVTQAQAYADFTANNITKLRFFYNLIE